MNKNQELQVVPDKKISLTVMVIGTFELGVALLGLVLFALRGQMNINWGVFLLLLMIYGAMGTGLWAIQEWARFTNIILHLIAIPYAILTGLFLGGPSDWRIMSQILIAGAIIYFLSRPEIRHKFQTVVPKKRQK